MIHFVGRFACSTLCEHILTPSHLQLSIVYWMVPELSEWSLRLLGPHICLIYLCHPCSDFTRHCYNYNHKLHQINMNKTHFVNGQADTLHYSYISSLDNLRNSSTYTYREISRENDLAVSEAR